MAHCSWPVKNTRISPAISLVCTSRATLTTCQVKDVIFNKHIVILWSRVKVIGFLLQSQYLFNITGALCIFRSHGGAKHTGDRKCPPRYNEDGTVTEKGWKFVSLQGGGHHYHPQGERSTPHGFSRIRENFLQQTKEDILQQNKHFMCMWMGNTQCCKLMTIWMVLKQSRGATLNLQTYRVEASFMDFIQDYNTVLRESRVGQDLPEQTAVCHVLHQRVLAQPQTHRHGIKFLQYSNVCRCWVRSVTHLRCAVVKANLVANLSTQSALHLLSDPLGHCDGSHPAGLGDANIAIFTKAYPKRRRKPLWFTLYSYGSMINI